MRIKKLFLLFLALTMLTAAGGCSPETLLDKSVPETLERFARDFISKLEKGEVEAAEDLLDPMVPLTKPLHQKFVEVSEQLKVAGVDEVHLVRHTRIKSMIGENIKAQFTYEIKAGTGYYVSNIAVGSEKGKMVIQGMYIEPIPGPLSEINAFTLKGKSIRHYAMLIFVIGIPLFVLYTLYLCYNSTWYMKWVWIASMIPGIGNISLNWTSGKLALNIVSISSVWAPAFRDGQSGAWYLTFAIPIISLAFYYKYRKLGPHGN